MLESINEERAVMPRGQTGDDSFTSIHFQVLSIYSPLIRLLAVCLS